MVLDGSDQLKSFSVSERLSVGSVYGRVSINCLGMDVTVTSLQLCAHCGGGRKTVVISGGKRGEIHGFRENNV